jgi:UDP-N-acetylmuramate dehydrogenase
MEVGGPARWFVEAATTSDVCAALRWAAERGVPVVVLGGGSNVVIADRGIEGLVLRVTVGGLDTAGLDTAGRRVAWRAGAGEPWDRVVAATVAAGCAGLECLSGIPGLTGGTPIQNVGAYGQEVASVIDSVEVVDRRTLDHVSLTGEECAFGYRTSRFKRGDAERFVVTAVTFALQQDGVPTVAYADLVEALAREGVEAPTLQQVREATLQVRRRKGMVIEEDNPARRSCGSFFLNPVITRADFTRIVSACAPAEVPSYPAGVDRVKVPAAWLIERAGFPKGFRRGTVGISPLQAQAIVNLGGACADDVVQLALDVKRAVWRTFGVVLVPEPQLLGFAPSPEIDWLQRGTA